MAKWSPEKKDIYKVLMTKEEEIRNSMREQREDAYNDGREFGREEGLVLAAKNMKSQGLPIDTIIAVTGLSMEVCEAL